MYLDWERTREKDYDSQLCIRGLFYITENGKYGLSSRNMTDFLIAPVYDDIIPVSYTHLDVYKRQTLYR